MTQSSDRLDRIEALVEANATAITTMRQRQEEADQSLRESISAANQELRESISAANQELRESISATNEQLNASIVETVAMIGGLAEQQEETDQRFNNLLADSRADRQNNEREHQAFRESFQTLLAEIARIWQRLAG